MIIVVNFAKLNLWSLLISKMIVVETCKKIPITTAEISVLNSSIEGYELAISAPSGDMNAKNSKNSKVFFLL